MDLKDLGKQIINLGAPALGMAIAGPAGAAIATTIAAKFNSPSTRPEDILKAFQADPEAQIKLKQIESDENVKLQELAHQEIDTRITAQVADLANARDANVKRNDNTARNLAYIIYVEFILCSIYFMWLSATPHDHIDSIEGDIIKQIFLIISVSFAAVNVFYFGSKFLNSN